ncbi:MAG TPA: hypothetical protein VD838_20370, partial [Anaeromyxobacteraceae bacterium]|nr:hypothetical protein [Anaeromyxobacteraceae bacterium]
MIFYGDREEARSPRAEVDAIAAGLAACARLPAGAERHARIAGLLARAGALAQALGDEARRRGGRDGVDAGERAAMALAVALAEALVASWRSGGRAAPPGDGALATLRSTALPDRVRTRVPE